MKSKFLILTTFALALTGCGSNESTADSDLRIVTPTGAPAIAFYHYYEGKQNFATTADPNLLPSYFGTNNYDIIVAPTNVGIKCINNGCSFKLAATITFGNFYLVSTGLDDNDTLDNADSIVLFQQGGVPDKIFHYIYGNEFDNNITYVKNVAFAATAFENKYSTNEDGVKVDADYVLLAEPKLTALKPTTQIIDLRNEFKKKSNGLDIYQASIFVNSSLDVSIATSFLGQIKDDIEKGLANPDSIVEGLNKDPDPLTFFGINPSAAKAITAKNNGLGLGYKEAKINKEGIDNFISCFGMEKTDESIYF